MGGWLGGSSIGPISVEKWVWMASLAMAAFGSTHQEDMKLGQCLDVNDMTSPYKSGEIR